MPVAAGGPAGDKFNKILMNLLWDLKWSVIHWYTAAGELRGVWVIVTGEEVAVGRENIE